MRNQPDPQQDQANKPALDLEQLPDSASLKAIQTALWAKNETRGAAVMVGAGLTRTAARAAHDAPPPPLWNDLAAIMANDLYPNSNRHPRPDNPLTLAQEFEASRGRNSLDNLIRTSINDQALSPGTLHKNLLELPWTDMLTTNWDTLLERTAYNNPERRYETVITTRDIPRTRAPRIIKLHGTLPSNTPFISTEEDFRTYPQRFAPFVNLAQQILMENVLCLIGFSGDDPNFIQWTGWVRDNLGKQVPPIYLVGALDLAQPTRRRLEDRGVKPIDLAPLLQELEPEDRHAEAIKRFIDALKDAKPWPPQRWPEQPKRQTKIDQPLLEEWQILRRTYPGWIVAPRTTRISIDIETRSQEQTLNKTLEEGTAEELHALLYEYAWRLNIALKPLPQEILEQLEAATIGTTLDHTKREQLAGWLLRHAREHEDHDAFLTWQRWIESHMPHLQHRVAWELCLQARDILNLKAIEEHLPLIEDEDPIWTLRRAALHAECNNKEHATGDVLNALRELRTRQAQDRHSIWIASRLAWALFFCQALAGPWNNDKRLAEELGEHASEWPAELTAMRCEPWHERQGTHEELREAHERSQRVTEETTYSFDPGQATRTTHRFPGIPETAHVQARRLFDQAGIPRGILNLNFTRDQLKTTTRIEGTHTPTQITRLVSIHPDDKLIDEQLSRAAIARLPIEVVDETINRLRSALNDTIRRYRLTADDRDQWGTRAAWVHRAAHIAEALSRLIIMTNTTTIQQTVNETFTTIRETPVHWTLTRKLHHLIKRAIAALPPEKQAPLLLPAIELPLPGEDDTKHQDPDLPEATDAFSTPELERAADEHRWERRIADLTQLVGQRGLVRERAIYRLMQLHTWTILTGEERQAFAQALWSEPAGDDKLPVNTGLFSHVMLALPEPSPGIARRAFEHEVVALNQPHQPMARDLVALLNAAHYLPEACRYQLSRTQAQAWLSRITEKIAHFSEPQDKGLRFSPTEGERFLHWVGQALAKAILPALTPNDLSDEIVDQLLNLEAPGTVVALPGLVACKPSLQNTVVDRLRHLLVGAEAEWGYAAEAVLEWLRLDEAGKTKLPDDLVSLVSGAVLSRHRRTLASTLDAATELVRQGRLSHADHARLESGLTYLFADLDYSGEHIGAYAEVSLLRARCATLALALKRAGRDARIIDHWLSTAAHDPLPDVREAVRETR